MHIFRDIKHFKPDPSRPLFLTVGNFDGLHAGHQAILHKVLSEAGAHQGNPSVLTFQEHPRQILDPQSHPVLLTSNDYKLFLLEQLGIETCLLLHFTKDFSQLSGADFIQKILAGRLKVRKVFLGYNARFGHDRAGDAALMAEYSKKLGFEFEEMAPIKASGDFISSSRIRTLVENGKLKEAGQCLGRSFGILGTVARGDQRGKELGFPTANLEVPPGILLPPAGVYAVQVRLMDIQKKNNAGIEERKSTAGAWHTGVLNYGSRPTFAGKGNTVPEVHILDFNQDIYGRSLEVLFQSHLRDEKKFDTPDALKRQIQEDIRRAQ